MRAKNLRVLGGVGEVWKEIGKLAGKPRLAAVAYLGDNAPYLLGQFSRGDVIVCDASDESIQGGSTSRKALKDFVRRGVHVYSLKNLHAKVICIGQTAVIGSMNASASSTSMHEAAVFLTREVDVIEARAVVRRYAAESTAVDASFLRRIEKLKVSQRRNSAPPKGSAPTTDEYITIGVVVSGDPPKYIQDAAAKTATVHEKLAGFKIRNCWAGRGERRNLNLGELVIWVYSDRGANPRLEIGRIIDYERIRDRWIYFDLTPTKGSSVHLSQLKQSLAAMQFKGNLDDLGTEWRRIRLPGIEDEVTRLFGKSTPPRS